MTEQIIYPTTRSRANALLRLAVVLGVVFALGFGANQYAAHVAPLSACGQLPWIRVAILLGAFGLLATFVVCFRGGLRIWLSGQFPAPGSGVLFATKVSTGWWAYVNAVSLFLFAAVAGAAFVALVRFSVFSEFGMYLLGFRSCGA